VVGFVLPVTSRPKAISYYVVVIDRMSHMCKYFALTTVIYMLRQALLMPAVQVKGYHIDHKIIMVYVGTRRLIDLYHRS
jgi:hypothetical protein